jgi:hypothetical protein
MLLTSENDLWCCQAWVVQVAVVVLFPVHGDLVTDFGLALDNQAHFVLAFGNCA